MYKLQNSCSPPMMPTWSNRPIINNTSFYCKTSFLFSNILVLKKNYVEFGGKHKHQETNNVTLLANRTTQLNYGFTQFKCVCQAAERHFASIELCKIKLSGNCVQLEKNVVRSKQVKLSVVNRLNSNVRAKAVRRTCHGNVTEEGETISS